VCVYIYISHGIVLPTYITKKPIPSMSCTEHLHLFIQSAFAK